MKGAGYYPATINAMKEAGADRIFVVGGVPAMALMAFGMGGVEPVDILCGAGNKFVAEAKRQLFGQCGIDLLAGPTEIAIIADDSADPALVACDLLGQAEHDPNSGAALHLPERGVRAGDAARGRAPTGRAADARHRRGCPGATTATSMSPKTATKRFGSPTTTRRSISSCTSSDPDFYFERLNNYGSLFIGEETTVAYGDKSIGTNHILPTSRSAALHRRRVGRQIPEDRARTSG